MVPRVEAWRPLLSGESKERAEAAVIEVAGALAGADVILPASLGSGGPGLAILFAYLARARPGEGHEERAGIFLDAAIDAVAGAHVDASLYAGFTGVAWATEHILGESPDDDPNEAIDEALIALLEQSPWRDETDLISGLVGLAVHALERLPRPSGRRCLELILDRLDETAERRDGRATWRTPPELLPEHDRRQHPDGYYNVGVAHGVPGLVAVLGPMAAAEIGGGRARKLLGEAAAWVLDQRLDAADGASLFPYFVGPGISRRPGRFAWCYGDPGVAAALLGAARAVGDPELEGAAMAVARRAAREPATRPDVMDAGLCHGAAGVAHLFNRIHQATGDEACAAAARRWFERALEMRVPGEGLGGYLSHAGADGSWRIDPGLCTGAAGTALALLAGTSAIEPAWDRVLLASSVRP